MSAAETRAVGIIPARYGSTRLPGKPLVTIGGAPMILHVFERAKRASLLSEVIVATDDDRIRWVVEQCGGRVVMTSSALPSGSDRIAVAAEQFPYADIIVNIQVDEPLLPPENIDACVQALVDDRAADVATPAIEISDPEDLQRASVVKVVTDWHGYALYFSRAPIPYVRDTGKPFRHFKHIGLYAYRREALRRFIELPAGHLERCEQLEQLRLLEHGMKIRVVLTTLESVAVDTPEDVMRVSALLGK